MSAENKMSQLNEDIATYQKAKSLLRKHYNAMEADGLSLPMMEHLIELMEGCENSLASAKVEQQNATMRILGTVIEQAFEKSSIVGDNMRMIELSDLQQIITKVKKSQK